MDTIFDSGISLILWLQTFGEGFVTLMKGFTFLGNEEFYLLIFPALYWCIDSTLGLRTGIMLMVSGTINSYFKWIFHLPRPFWYSTEVKAHAIETGFGAPSGHSQNAVAVWGLMASSIQKPWAWITAVLLMFLIGLSRMVLGMHFYLDVLSGWLLGAIVLWVFLRFEKPVSAWINKYSIAAQISLMFAISMGSLLIGSLILAVVGGIEIPAVWVQNANTALQEVNAIDPFSMSGVVTNAAVLFGLVSGAILMKARGGFEVKAASWKLALRYLVGLIGVLAIWMGLDLIFPDGHDFVAYAFRYLRYGLAGIWMSLGAPWVFIRLKLAEPAQKLH
ncbi:MAG TPA: phosphoesterase PA-phosphatase [Chloroflexi bacterium]|nr:phosphoesterase PA-phosphatase [Chloroflexota bacterium]